jgi:hypothetical protein
LKAQLDRRVAVSPYQTAAFTSPLLTGGTIVSLSSAAFWCMHTFTVAIFASSIQMLAAGDLFLLQLSGGILFRLTAGLRIAYSGGSLFSAVL